jgi:hypothetical protein
LCGALCYLAAICRLLLLLPLQLRSEKDQFLLLACDGIWDVMTNEEAAEFILAKVADGVETMGGLAEELIDECLNRGSRDNMSAVIVALPGAPKAPKCVCGGVDRGCRRRRGVCLPLCKHSSSCCCFPSLASASYPAMSLLQGGGRGAQAASGRRSPSCSERQRQPTRRHARRAQLVRRPTGPPSR